MPCNIVVDHMASLHEKKNISFMIISICNNKNILTKFVKIPYEDEMLKMYEL